MIRCRTDLAVHATPRVDLLEDREALHCFRFGFDPNSDWCNDQFAFGSSDVMDRYAECYEHLHEGRHRGPDHGPVLLVAAIRVVEIAHGQPQSIPHVARDRRVRTP
ncbi:MAG: hypothetical protein H6832_16630 [Planctomycetes bacterium]|nr:hypothetical protein [Planctomycetota bacterium]MCB9920030.1 hypothetical protein [Planctomycetota bacterium]